MPVFLLSKATRFPDPTLAEPDGLLAVGGDLSVERLLNAYSAGIFPWYSQGSPILWWSPAPRLIIEPAKVHVPSSLKRVINSGRFEVTFDTDFEMVIRGCAGANRPDAPGTWIVPEMIRAYVELHLAGFAHSAEARIDGRLVGGVYGVALGRAFFGESMFFAEPDASKVAFATLARKLLEWGYGLIDCQQTTRHMQRFGGFEVGREEFTRRLAEALAPDQALEAPLQPPGAWTP